MSVTAIALVEAVPVHTQRSALAVWTSLKLWEVKVSAHLGILFQRTFWVKCDKHRYSPFQATTSILRVTLSKEKKKKSQTK
jgi:hypothetical protein